MMKIKLTRGKYVLIDSEDFEYLNQWKWYYASPGYAARDIGGRKNKKRILMHRLLNKTPNDLVTDHINHNKLDNRKSNLRTVTQRQNTYNCLLSKNNSSGTNGVHWYKNRWVAAIKVNYKTIYLGRFSLLSDAIVARQLAEKKYAV